MNLGMSAFDHGPRHRMKGTAMRAIGMSPQRARMTLAAKRKRAAARPWILITIFVLTCAVIGICLTVTPHAHVAIATRDITAGEKVTAHNATNAEVASKLTVGHSPTPLAFTCATIQQAHGKRVATKIPRGSLFPLWALLPDRPLSAGQTVVTVQLVTSPDVLHVGQKVMLLPARHSSDSTQSDDNEGSALPSSETGQPRNGIDATIWSLAPPSSSFSSSSSDHPTALVQVSVSAQQADRLMSQSAEDGYFAVAQ
jgi:hypothetical protein